MEKTLVKEQIKNDLVTKKYLDEKIYLSRKELKSTENYLDFKIETVRKESEEFVKEFRNFKDSVLKTLDWLVGAFTKFSEEHMILSEQNKRTNGKLNNHEKRIFSLEQRVSTP